MNRLTTLELVQNRVEEMSRDYWDDSVPSKDIWFESLKNAKIGMDHQHELKPVAQRQIANRLGIPLLYLERCPTHVQSYNLNHWMAQERNERLFLRFDGNSIRAVFTPVYKPVNHKDILAQLFQNGYKPETEAQCCLDEEMMLLNLPNEEKTFMIDGKDRMQQGISVANSEVGISTLDLSTFVLRLVCTNGLIAKTAVSSSYRHVSERILQEFPALLSRLNDEMDETQHRWKISLNTPVDNPQSTLESFNRQFNLDSEQRKAVLEWAWQEESGSSMFQIVNAYTKAAQYSELTVEQSFRLQRVGGFILAMLN